MVCCCKPNTDNEKIEAIFSPGIVEYNYINTNLIDSINIPVIIEKISLSDYSFLHSILSSLKKEMGNEATPPYIFIKFNSIQYKIGENRIVETEKNAFAISESEDYRIRCIIHFYDFIDKETLDYLQEIKQFGMPTDYQYKPSDPHKPTKPFVKIVLKRQ